MNRTASEKIQQRDSLLQKLGDAVKEVHLCISCPGGCKLWESLVAARLIYFLDRVLLFGLQKPCKGYWRVLVPILPKSTVAFINQLPSITNNLGKGRAWLLLSLNEGVLEGFLATLEARPSLLNKHYQHHALLRDSPSLQILITLVSGLEHVGFDFAIDVAHLNQNIVEAPLMRFIHENDSSSPAQPAADPQLELVTSEKTCPSSEEKTTEDSQEIEAVVPSIMNSPLVKRRSHLKGVLQDTPKHRVSFQEEASNRDRSPAPSRWINSQPGPHQRLSSPGLAPAQNLARYKSEWALSNDKNDNSTERAKTPTRNHQRLRRYRSDLYLSRPRSETSLVDKQDSPEMERGVPEGQEDPQRIHSILNLSSLQSNCTSPTEETLPPNKSRAAKQRLPSIGCNKASSPSSLTNSSEVFSPGRVAPTLEDKRRWLVRARQKWSRSLDVALPVPAPMDTSVDWDGCRQAWQLEMDVLHRAHRPTNMPDPDPLAKQLAQTLGLDADDRYERFPCHVDFFGGQPRPTYLLLGSKAMHVTLSQSSSLLWSAALFDIEEIAVTWNYTVLAIRSAVSRLVLNFHDTDALRRAVSCLDIVSSHQQRNNRHKERAEVVVETPFQLHQYWRPWLCRLTKERCDEIHYMGGVYYEESFVSTTAGGESVLGPYKEGHLMYRWSSAPSRTWHVGYFIFKAGVLYQFGHQSDKVPTFLLPLGGEQCKGYGRNFHSSRPHTVEIQLNDRKCLYLAAASEEEGSEWLALFAQGDMMWQNPLSDSSRLGDVTDHRPPVACGLIVTSRHLVLFQTPGSNSTANERHCVATAPLESIPVVLISPSEQPDAFCVIEFECREASEGTGDWILYFESRSSAEDFVRATSRPRQTLDARITTILRNKLFVLRHV